MDYSNVGPSKGPGPIEQRYLDAIKGLSAEAIAAIKQSQVLSGKYDNDPAVAQAHELYWVYMGVFTEHHPV